MKAAYTVASDLQLTGPLLNRLFHSSFAVGKRVRTETGLGEGAVSVSYAAIALAKKIFGKLSGLGVLILGAGEMAKLTAMHLKAQHVRQMTIASRTLKAAEGLAARLDATAVPWTELDARSMSADIVVTATGATEPVLTRAAGRRGDAASGATVRSSSSTSPCRATSSRLSAISSRCSSTTSTISRRS